MKKFALLAILFTACTVEYQGLIVDKYYVTAEVDADSGIARVKISRKYSSSPVSARVMINGHILESGGPGFYTGNVSGNSFNLRIETFEERMDLTVSPPAQTNLTQSQRGDTVEFSWLPAENANFYRLIILEVGDTILDTAVIDTTVSVPVSEDSLRYVFQIISGPNFEDGNILPNFENDMWEVYFRVIRSLSGYLPEFGRKHSKAL